MFNLWKCRWRERVVREEKRVREWEIKLTHFVQRLIHVLYIFIPTTLLHSPLYCNMFCTLTSLRFLPPLYVSIFWTLFPYASDNIKFLTHLLYPGYMKWKQRSGVCIERENDDFVLEVSIFCDANRVTFECLGCFVFGFVLIQNKMLGISALLRLWNLKTSV